MDSLLKPISDFMADQYAEATAEKIGRNKPLSYWCTLFDDCVYSPRDFYALVQKNLDRRQVPDLLVDYILLHEGTVFSKKRLYHQMRRERIVAEICAAPFGSGFFISSRLFDRRKHAFWWDYLFAFITLAGTVWKNCFQTRGRMLLALAPTAHGEAQSDGRCSGSPPGDPRPLNHFVLLFTFSGKYS